MRKATLAFIIVLFALAASASAERIRAHIFVIDGQLQAARNRITDSPLDVSGGGLNEFSVDLRRVGGGGPGWNGASWLMERTGLATVSFELFMSDVIEELNMKHNTGVPNVQVVTYIHCLNLVPAQCEPGDDFDVTMSPIQGFIAALADLEKKPWALERLPDPPI